MNTHRLVTELSAEELVEGIGFMRAILAKHGVVSRLAVHVEDWPILESKLLSFCERHLLHQFLLLSPISELLSLSIYVTTDIPKGTIHVGPWLPEELERRTQEEPFCS
jgi:hypothetical protein